MFNNNDTFKLFFNDAFLVITIIFYILEVLNVNKSRLKRITLQPGPNLGLTELQNANKADCHMRFLKCCLIMKLVSETDLINALHCGTWMFN